MSKANRNISTLSMSFLDIMCCGFGAVILLVMIINGKTLQKRVESQDQLQSTLERAILQKEAAVAHIEKLRDRAAEVELEEGELLVRAEKLREALQQKQDAKEQAQRAAEARAKEIEALRKEIDTLTEARKKHEADQSSRPGPNLVGFDGEGRRQYLTGLKLGGEHTLILVDVSASMLDETVVKVIRRKLMVDDVRRRAPKWQRAVRTLHWLVSNMQRGRKFQVYSFAAEAKPLIAGTDGQWLDTSDAKQLDEAIAVARRVAPKGGTNLYEALNVIPKLKPRPDSVLLLTDGLPTLGKEQVDRKTVSSEQRLKIFAEAVEALPHGVPINVILFPMEGDPFAAAAFWGLAIDTDGSFITPSRDWP